MLNAECGMLNGGGSGLDVRAGEDGEDRRVRTVEQRAAGDRARRSLPVGTRRGERPGESGEVHALEERIGGIAQPRAGQGAGAGGGEAAHSAFSIQHSAFESDLSSCATLSLSGPPLPPSESSGDLRPLALFFGLAAFVLILLRLAIQKR